MRLFALILTLQLTGGCLRFGFTSASRTDASVSIPDSSLSDAQQDTTAEAGPVTLIASGPGQQTVADLALSADDELYVVGRFVGESSFVGGAKFSPNGGQDGYILQMRDGQVQWLRRFGGTSSDQIRAVHLGPNQTVYFVGSYSGTVNFDGQQIVGNGTDGFIARLNASDGSLLNLATISSSAKVEVHDLTIENGQVFVAGSYAGSVVSNGNVLPAVGAQDTFVYALSADLATTDWGFYLGGPANDMLGGISASANAVYVGATIDGDGTVGNSADAVIVPSNGARDAVVAKLTFGGALTWAHAIGGSGQERVFAVQANGDVVWVGGEFTGSTVLAGQSIDSTIPTAFAVQLNAAGNDTVGVVGDGAMESRITAFERVTGTSVLVGGYYTPPFVFGNTTVDTDTLDATRRGFVAAIGGDTVATEFQIRSTDEASISAVTANRLLGKRIAGGNFSGTLAIGGHTAEDIDGFIYEF